MRLSENAPYSFSRACLSGVGEGFIRAITITLSWNRLRCSGTLRRCAAPVTFAPGEEQIDDDQRHSETNDVGVLLPDLQQHGQSTKEEHHRPRKDCDTQDGNQIPRTRAWKNCDARIPQ